VKIGLFGTGRLGRAIAAEAGASLAWQVGRGAPPTIAVDVAIEATVAAAVEVRVAWALEHGTPLVIGTTGWALTSDLERRVAGKIGVVVAPNFSLGVAFARRLAVLLGRFAAQDATRDPYVVELHHSKKHDAPSGTATLLARAVMDGCPRKTQLAIAATGAIRPEQLSVGVVRAGSIPGTHTVGVDLPGETLELTHTARGPAVFGQGALAAARWVVGKKGLFTMDDVTRDLLDPLFRAEVK
jgi:4-hydroxy-tetrahydrodipicolinate reductase